MISSAEMQAAPQVEARMVPGRIMPFWRDNLSYVWEGWFYGDLYAKRLEVAAKKLRRAVEALQKK